jgi:hypothetical protein
MSEQDNTPQEGMNPEPEVVEETTAEETVETPAQAAERTFTENQFRQMEARAKKAESDLRKALEGDSGTKAAKPINNVLSGEQIEITVLRAQGMSEDEISYLRKLAKVNETSIIEAQKDELFSSFKAKKESDAKAQKAKLGASRGSSTVRKEKDLNSSGLTDAEHKALWKQQMTR